MGHERIRAPAAFKQAAEAAAGYYSQMFSNNEVINIDVGWGEADGIPVSSGDLADSVRPGIYRDLCPGLVRSRCRRRPFERPGPGGFDLTFHRSAWRKFYYVPYAEAKTLGYISSTGTEVDGYIGMSKTASLDFAQPTAAGYFDAVGALEHEISAVMGRVDAVGSAYGAGIYTPLDLFRYSAPGVHAASASAPTPYFSINSGVTNCGN